MMYRDVAVTDIVQSPKGGNSYERIVWRVPLDFDENEERLLAEICANGAMTEDDATRCVRLLRN